MVYYNNNGEIWAYDSVEVYENYGRYDSNGDDRGMVIVTLEQAQVIIAEKAAAKEFDRVAALNIPERIAHMEGLANSVIEIECKNEKYFYGAGFVNGGKSIRNYPNNPDAVKLSNWKKEIWTQIESWVKAIYEDSVDASDFDTIFIAENLPSVDDF